MESLIPILRMLHFIGFAMLLGGSLCSVIVSKRSPHAVKAAYDCLHIIAAPGLSLLLLTGVMQSAIMHWENFINAGYMHAKITIVLIVLVLLIYDIRTQKSIITNKWDQEEILKKLKTRQIIALANCTMIIIIMWLINYRPF